MPPYTTAPPLLSLIGRDTIANVSNTTIPQAVVQVVCAWPVSGQYGFGTRILYYFFVAACVLARRTEWLRNACLAAALLLPAVAAIHAVVLAAVHVSTAVDMDIYGAFQICSIGILAAPITVYNSKTYFNDPGRNIIFLWTGLLLAGMLSLTVEFIRTDTHPCAFDNTGAAIDPFNLAAFPYMNADCSLNCVYGPNGPFSPIRRDSTNEPAVIPVPQRLTFSAVTLLAAGSSIPPVLTLIPFFGIIVVILLVFGELNFWSTPVSYQTEPFSSIGQWSNVVATVLVVLGSLFYVERQRDADKKEGTSSNHSYGSRSPRGRLSSQSNRDQESVHSDNPETASRIVTVPAMDSRSIHHDAPRNVKSDEQRREVIELETVTTNTNYEPIPSSISNRHRNKVATLLNKFGDYLGTPAQDRYDNTVFKEGKAEFPEIPGEAGRVAGFEEIRDWYRNSHQPEDDGSIIPLSRANSSSSMRIFEAGPEDRNTPPSRQARSPSRSRTIPVEQNGYSQPELSRVTTTPVAGSGPRRATLEVPNRPRPVHLHLRNSSSSSTRSPAMLFNTEGSPRIVVSAEPEETLPTTPNTPTINTLPLGSP
ncbi:hypothetical protein E0Z10_g350 [Xylaria hypoxylon]|uniref:Uncharacterized protein n=1 Tax=Xylaria hypoxylon TaxID=37992 RepID=A0A4Z0ZHP9_9PEZI|nr:hypothetical protein E0Z10_g350 [Xylaria hypoxylon]